MWSFTAMRAMAYKFLSYLACHPLITATSVLLLFTFPIFHMLVFFWPLIVSTTLGVLAVVSFGRQSERHSTPPAGCGTAEEGAQQSDIDGFPPHEEKISNVLMVGDQEVTWLEWLHNEDARKVRAHGCESAVWDAYGSDGSMMSAGEVSVVDSSAMATIDTCNSFTYREEAIHDGSLQANDNGELCAGWSRDKGKTHVSALALTDESERPSSTVFDVFRGTATVLEVVNTKKATVNAPVLRAAGDKNVNSTGEGQMCRSGGTAQNSIDDGEGNTHAPTCAEEDEGQMSIEGLYLIDGRGNESKTLQGSLHSAIYTKKEVNGYASVGGDEAAGIAAEAAIGSNLTVHSACGIARPLNKCVPEGKAGLRAAVSTLEEIPEAIPLTSEPKIVPTDELDALSNKTISPSLQMKGADVRGARHADKQDDIEMGSNHFETQDPQWDASDGEEDQSSLRFSFFHSSSPTASQS